MHEKKINNVLFMATGALLSPTSTLQGESIPAVAHAVSISNNISFGG
jgi:stage V sporulation protein AD